MRKKEFGLWHDITWHDYHQNVSHIACALMSMGLERGDCAAIIGDNCPEWVSASVAIQCCGAATAGVYATNA
jgi:long-chain acyl-CoA synthetase